MPDQVETVDEAWRRLGRGDFEGALELSRRLLARAPGDPSLLSCVAMSNWQVGGDIGESVAMLERAVRLAPELASIRHNLGIIQASNGAIDAACRNFRKAIELKPDDTEAFHGLSQNYRFTEGEPVLRQMLAQYSAGALPQRSLEFVCFGLAKAYADLRQYDRAMHFCLEANRLGQRPYDAERPRVDLAELRRMTGADAFRDIPAGPPAGGTPIFIVGMPRSGTTLVESILARHPQVFAGGEMTHMLRVEQALLNWARHNRQFSGGPHEMLKLMPIDYFTRNAAATLRKVTEAAARPFTAFTDKLPENSQRLGLIEKLFPNARVIYIRRHALDCCLSNLFQRFTHGQGFAFRQDLLGERYRQVTESMQLWKRALDLPIMEVSYAALVSDPEPMVRRIVAFAGLPWDEACLSPEQGERRVMTASQFQVKQPINRNSVDRWRVYEEWLQPLIVALGGLDWIEAESRDMETLVG